MIAKELMKQLVAITREEQDILNGKNNIDRRIYTEGGGMVINSRKLLSKGKLITLRPHTRFVHFPKHSHDFIEVVYMCSGETTHIVNGDTVHLKEGELLLLGQNAEQEIFPASEEDVAVNFIILPEFFNNPLDALKDEETPLKTFITDSLKCNGQNSCYMHFKVADILPVQNLIENLIWTLMKKGTAKRKISSTIMSLLFLELMNYTGTLSHQDKQERAIIDVLRYVDENYRDGTLSELAEQLHYDRSWLSREIKKKTGKTFTDIIQEKRLAQSCFFLKNTDINISDIALMVGYDNISYFHRLFRGRYGVSPRHYRCENTN